MDISIERLQKADLSKYKSLIDECFGGSNEQKIYDQNYVENSDKYQILVAKDEDKIVGSLTFFMLDLFTYSFQPAIEIFNVCVLEKYRGQKIAKKLFIHTQDLAKEHNYKSIHLTCLDTATDAHRLYESMGMKKANSVKYFKEI